MRRAADLGHRPPAPRPPRLPSRAPAPGEGRPRGSRPTRYLPGLPLPSHGLPGELERVWNVGSRTLAAEPRRGEHLPGVEAPRAVEGPSDRGHRLEIDGVEH